MILLAPWIVPAATAALGAVGRERANRINISEAQKNRVFQSGQAQRQMDFQERMRNTAWQASVADMEAAGLNPALAYSQGPAAAPGGSAGGGSLAAPVGDSVSSAMDALQKQKGLKLLSEQIRKTEGEADSAEAKATIDRATRAFLINLEGDQDEAWLRRKIRSEIEAGEAAVGNVRALTDKTSKESDILGPKARIFESIDDLLGPALEFLRSRGGPAMNRLRPGGDR